MIQRDALGQRVYNPPGYSLPPTPMTPKDLYGHQMWPPYTALGKPLIKSPVPEDAFELPPNPIKAWPEVTTDTRAEDPAHEAQYSAEYTTSGGAVLVLHPPAKTIATFETFADAQTAAKALNEAKGY